MPVQSQGCWTRGCGRLGPGWCPESQAEEQLIVGQMGQMVLWVNMVGEMSSSEDLVLAPEGSLVFSWQRWQES